VNIAARGGDADAAPRPAAVMSPAGVDGDLGGLGTVTVRLRRPLLLLSTSQEVLALTVTWAASALKIFLASASEVA